jgi:hypothetical protein
MRCSRCFRLRRRREERYRAGYLGRAWGPTRRLGVTAAAGSVSLLSTVGLPPPQDIPDGGVHPVLPSHNNWREQSTSNSAAG